MDWRRELMGGLSSEMNIDNYLTIEALEDGLTVSLSTNACQYCVDGDGNWKSLAAGTATQSINSGQTLSFRGNLTPTTNTGIGTFTVNKNFNLKGNCMSMLFGNAGKNNYSLSGKDYAFKNLFRKCTTLKSVVNSFLPATTLANYCYSGIFDGCTNLTTAPELPATTLTDSCYYCMFYECTNLTIAPALPATTLANSCYSAMFRSTGLVTAPELPATILTDYCYSSMFHNCRNLINAPTLPAIILFSHCYDCMFYGCSKLVTAPELPATTLANYCYYMMFYNCWKLTNAPTLPATVLANSCYHTMFQNCTSLITAPALPATTLAEGCYGSMFSSCGSLTTAPELPATTLAKGCYKYMFYDCPKLVKAPELPATTLVEDCYYAMFGWSSNLNYIKAMFTTTPGSSYTSGWVNNVSSTGTFVKNPEATWDVTGAHGIPSGWTVVNDGEPVININNYLTIEALENGLTASLSTNACEYCVDGDGNWKSLAAGTATESINSGHTLSFRGELAPTTNGIGTFTISKKCNLKGNCMSMLFGDNAANNYSLSGKNYAFYRLFYNCTNIVNVSESFLPATTLATNCYYYMFRDCTSLTSAPALPATTLADYCYYYMFYGCTSLTTAPELPATTLATSCYSNMFRGCTSLTTAPELPATTLADYCYYSMFRDCTSLTTAPELPATTLTTRCYERMFYNCRSLNYIKMLATDISASSCLSGWVNGVASTGTFVKNKSATWNVTGANGVPSGWTIQKV